MQRSSDACCDDKAAEPMTWRDSIGIRDATRISPRLMLRVVVSGPPMRASSVFLVNDPVNPVRVLKTSGSQSC